MLALLTSTARRVAGAAMLALLLAGVPWALLRYLHPPLPDSLPSWHDIATTLTTPLTDQTLGAILVGLLWLAWTSFAWSVIAELAAALTGVRLPQPRALTPARGLAALLVATITGGVLATAAHAATPPLSSPTQANPGTTVMITAASDTSHPASGRAATAAGTDTPSAAAAPARKTETTGNLILVAAGREYTYTVKRGDTLSEIAEQWLGDPHRWPEIFALNRGTHFTNVGGTLRNPNIIYPGWTLDLPADATPPAGHQPRPAPPKPPTERPDTEAPTPPTNPDVTPTAGPTATRAPAPTPTPSTTATAPTPTSSGTTAPAPTTATLSTSDAAGASPTHTSRPNRERHNPGVPLPTGSWVDLGLALAIAAAAALVWAHRQRRYTPRKPSALPRLGDPNLAPMPPIVSQIRRALQRTTAGQPDTPDHDPADRHTDEFDGSDDHPTAATHRDPDDTDAQATHGRTGDPDTTPAAAQDVAEQGSGEPTPVSPALAHPLSTVWPPAGLGLTGPGAEAAARGFLTAALAAGGPDHPEARAQVVMPSATAATLLGAAAVTLPRTPRLTITAGLDDALEILEAQTLHRTRLVYQHEVDTVTDLRAADPYEEPLPPIILLADATGRHERARIAALLTQGQRLDIHGVLLGTWPDGNTVDVAHDGTTTPADGVTTRHGSHPADVGRLAVINPDETATLLATLAESHTGQLPAPAPAEAAPTPDQDPEPLPPAHPTTQPDDAQPPTEAAAKAPTRPVDSGTAGSSGSTASATDSTARGGPAAAEDTDDPGEGHASATAAPTPPRTQTTAGMPIPVEVAVLGTPGIVGADPQRSLRAKSLELLVYLAVRDGSASAEAILDDLLPDAPASKAVHRLHTYVSDLRSVLRHNAGPGSYLTHPNHRYQLNAQRFDIDLWRMRAAIRAADGATSKPERVAALRRAVDTYRRPLAQGCEYEWLEPYREAIRQEALDATVALAEELTGHPAEQLAVLDAAIPQHPYGEELYQTAMRAHAQLGDLDAVRALRRTLSRQLAEIDAEPSDDTLTLADRLTADLRRGGHGSRVLRPPDEDGRTV
ncbi:BTAD domain-containing putative transcriptional regulator [Micromonospora sp. NPDC005806]|uniref:BTAD domain-containing putative transcriptional regulator n=1 Tax=Micromonospora sp. NPDC005806 TaxID=3364234 RepID=UPI0036AED6CD